MRLLILLHAMAEKISLVSKNMYHIALKIDHIFRYIFKRKDFLNSWQETIVCKIFFDKSIERALKI